MSAASCPAAHPLRVYSTRLQRRDPDFISFFVARNSYRFVTPVLILDRDAGEVAAPQLLAGFLGLALVETGKARPIVGLVALGHGLGERICVAERAHLALRRIEMLLGFALGAERADLDDPAGMRRRVNLQAA